MLPQSPEFYVYTEDTNRKQKSEQDFGQRTAQKMNDSWLFWVLCGILGWIFVSSC